MKRFGAILGIFGAVFLVMSFREGIASMKPYVDLYAEETNVSDIGAFDMVQAEVYAVLDCFASEVTTKDGKKTDEDYYYIIPAFNGDETYYIGVKVNDNSYKTYDQICDMTYEYLMGYTEDLGDVTTVTTGCLKKMSSKEKKYYYEWFEEMEWFDTTEEMNTYALPIYLDSMAKPEASKYMMFAGFGIFVVGAALLYVSFTKDKSSRRKAQQQQYVVIAGVSYPKSTFQHVDTCIQNQERIFAAQELHEITGISMEEAGEIVEKWNQYYF